MVDQTLEPSRFQKMFPGKADPNDFLTPVAPGAAGIGSLASFALGQKAAREGAHSVAESARFFYDALYGNISPWAFDPETGETVSNPAYAAGSMETALNVAAPSFTRSVLGTKGVANPTTLGIFASTGAKTANTEALDAAKTMFLEGKTRGEIRAATGWFPGADGVWRFEIPDTGFKVNTKSFTPEQLTEGVPLKDVIDHPEFLKAYPDAGDIKYRELKPGQGYLDRSSGGYFDHSNNEIVFSTQGHKGDNARERVGLHEIQHWVQKKEGMSPGSNPRIETSYRSALAENALQRERDARASEGILTRLKNKLTGKGEPTEKEMKEWVGKDAYMSAHGETESRNVERRFLENDYKTDPWRTIDRPAEFVIVDEEKAYRDLLKKQNQKQAAESGERNPWASVGWEDDVGGNTFGYSSGGLVTNPLDRYLNAEGIAALNAEELALARERMSMDQGPDRRQRQRMISAITDYYQSLQPKQADFSLLRPMGRRG